MPRRRRLAAWLAVVVVCSAPRTVQAGMPVITLTDLARARVQVISFFLLVLLVCAWAVRGIWNSLARDLPKLPRLSFGKACGLVALWGLLFLLVLTMISGARELLTPGAWEKVGLTNKLAEGASPSPPPSPRPDPRRAKIETFRDALWAYAREHDGRFPPGQASSPEVPEEAWQVPDPSGLPYVYIPGRRAGDPKDSIVAFEPVIYGAERYVLWASGRVERLAYPTIRAIIHGWPGAEDRP
jgi:hypothetical protein